MDTSSLEFSTFVLSILANISLVIIVLRYAPKERSRSLFALFVMVQTVWVVVNYFAIRSDQDKVLDMARWTIASVVAHPILFFLFIKSFLNKDFNYSKSFYIFSVICIGTLFWLARSEYLFTHAELREGQAVPIAGPGMAVFGLYSVIFIARGFWHIVSSWWKSKGVEKKQWEFIGIGLVCTFFLVLTFNFFLAVVSEKLEYVNFGHLYTLPFVLFTAYAMVKHSLLNIKALLAELAVILLILVLVVQLVNSTSLDQMIMSTLVLVVALILGMLLVRSVSKEVAQRELLQVLTGQLEDANEKLKALDKARAEFISIASHQLRTPPATIKWYIAAVRAGDFGKINPKVNEAVKKVEITNNTLISLIDDLLNVSRIERGIMEFLFEKGDFEELVNSAYEQLIPQSENRKLTLLYDRPKIKLPPLNIDHEKIQQVVNNLIDNALKYTNKGTVRVKLQRKANDIILSVTDSGKGMSTEEKATIFEKYKRGADSFQHSAGLGLGLYVAKVIVDHHHGEIWAESKGVGKGSTFFVKLPIKTDLSNETEFDMAKEMETNAANNPKK